MITPDEENRPMIVKDAIPCPDGKEWMKVVEEEMESMRVNQVWDLIHLLPGRKAIGNKWVLKIKRKSNGAIERYKARLVAKGYIQQWGIDYEETFSSIVRFASIQLILSLVTSLDLELQQIDVKMAFLNGELDEEIYMKQPVASLLEGASTKYVN